MLPYCPICKRQCLVQEDHGYFTKYFCYCDQDQFQEIDQLPQPATFSAYKKDAYSYTSTYYYEFNFRQPYKLWMNFSYGAWSIFYFKNAKVDVAHGQQQLSPWEGYRFLKRYQELKIFT